MKKITLLLIFLTTIYGFSQDGQLDSSFNINIDLNNEVSTIVEQTDGKLLIVGWFTANGIHPVYRLNQDGTLDTSFEYPSGINGTAITMAVQDDNKIIVGGGSPGFIKRLNQDGSLDPTFNVVMDPDGWIDSIRVLSDNKIMVAGEFKEMNYLPIQAIARLNTNGYLDTSFNLNLPLHSFVDAFEEQPDGKIILAGSYEADPSNQFLLFRRYNPDGSPDPTFLGNDPTSGNYIYDIELDRDGKILISGPFNKIDNITRYTLARLNSDGTLDTSFNSYNVPQNGTTYTIFNVKALDDGKYFINGSFHIYDDVASNSIAKNNNDGTIDTSFNIGTGPNDLVFESCIQQDRKILIGGEFTQYNGTPIKYIARIGNTLSIDENPFSEGILVYPNPFKDQINFALADNGPITISIYNLSGQLIKTETLNQFKTIDTESLANGIYLAHISSGKFSTSVKLIKQ